jgi:glucokinase
MKKVGGVVIGVDIGGTKMAAGIVRNGEVLRKMQVKTGALEGQTYVIGQLRALIVGVAAGDEIDKICIGIPGLFSGTNIIRLPHIPCMNGVDLKTALSPVIGDAELFLENDARSFVIAEHACGAAKGYKNVVGITLGTGLGAGIIINDEVYCGSHGSAGELGHVMFDTSLKSFMYGVGVWESLVSGHAITAEYERAGGHPELVSEMWAEHSPVAEVVRQDIVRKLAIFVANIMTTFDPDVVVFGGGAANEEMISSLNGLLPQFNARPLARISTLKSDAGILGACISGGEKIK